MVLIATDLPEPVVPAMSRCGMRARFATTGSPPMSLPRARGRAWALSPKPLAERISRRSTFSRSSFGSSMPMTERPGMVEQRQASADIERAMSSERPMTRRRLEAGGGLELVHGDDRAGADRDDLAAHAVVVEHVLEHARVLLERVVREVVADDGRGALQQREGRGAPGVGGLGVEGELGLLLGAGAGAFRDGAGPRSVDARLGRGLGRVALEDGDLGLGGSERRAVAQGARAGLVLGLAAGADGGDDLGHDPVLGRRAQRRRVDRRHRRRWRRGVRGAAWRAVRAPRRRASGGAGAAGGAGDGAAGQAVGAGVDDDRALAEEAEEAAALGPGDAEGVGGGHHEEDGEDDRVEAERDREIERQGGQERAERGVAEQSAEAVVVLPAGERHVGGREGSRRRGRRPGRRGRGGGRGPRRRAARSAGPRPRRPRDAVGGPAERAVQRIGERGADEPERVARRLVGGAEQARVVGRVGPDHRRRQAGEHEEQDADQLAAAPAQRDARCRSPSAARAASPSWCVAI